MNYQKALNQFLFILLVVSGIGWIASFAVSATSAILGWIYGDFGLFRYAIISMFGFMGVWVISSLAFMHRLYDHKN